MRPEIIKLVLDKYEIGYTSVLSAQKGYRNLSFPVVLDDITINLIIYKREPGILNKIRNANTAGEFLFAAGLPARHPYSSKNQIKIRKQSALRLPIQLLNRQYDCVEDYAMDRLKSLGHTMAQMHNSFEGLSLDGFLKLRTNISVLTTGCSDIFMMTMSLKP